MLITANSVWKWSAAVAAGIALTFALAYLVNAWFPDGNFASWVQGIGSILAIVGAVWAVSAQSRAAIETVRKNLDWTEERQRRALLAIVDAAKDRVDKILAVVDQKGEWRGAMLTVYARSILEGLAGALQAFPAHNLPSARAVTAFLLLQQHVIFFTDNTDSLIEGVWRNPILKISLEQSRAAFEATRNPADQERMLELVRSGTDALVENVRRQAVEIDKQVAVLHAELDSARQI